MLDTIKKLLSSRKAIAAVATVLVDLTIAYGLRADPAARDALIQAVTLIAGAYLLAQGAADVGKGAARIREHRR